MENLGINGRERWRENQRTKKVEAKEKQNRKDLLIWLCFEGNLSRKFKIYRERIRSGIDKDQLLKSTKNKLILLLIFKINNLFD